jgi:glycosyltransferase involved in cell wall biosynthesis
VGGIPDLWEDGKHGLLIPPKDVDAIVKAIKLLLCDASLRSRLVANAYQHASEFTAEECARRLACTLAEQWSENAEVLRPPSL